MGTSRWSFVFLMWYMTILCVQPQNRFPFLISLHIADIAVIGSFGMHFLASSGSGQSFMRFGTASRIAIVLMVMSFISLHTGPLQASSEWSPIMDIIFKNGFVVLLIETMAYNVQRIWGVLASLMLATLWWVKAGIRLSSTGATYSGDRIMGAAVGLVENPNAFAYLMAVMMPLYAYFFANPPRKWLRPVFLFLMLASVFIIIQTGSRTGFIAMLVVSGFIVWRYFWRQKVALAVGVISTFFIVSIVSPGNLERVKSFGSSFRMFVGGSAGQEKSASEMTQDEQSAWERHMKNRDTWELIKRYPVLGAGVSASDNLVPSELGFARGQVHNELLFAGKQMGFVGMALYLGFLGTLLICGIKTMKYARIWWPAAGDIGWTFAVQSAAFLAGGLFSPIPWNPVMMILAACSSAMLLNLRAGAYGLDSAPADGTNPRS